MKGQLDEMIPVRWPLVNLQGHTCWVVGLIWAIEKRVSDGQNELSGQRKEGERKKIEMKPRFAES